MRSVPDRVLPLVAIAVAAAAVWLLRSAVLLLLAGWLAGIALLAAASAVHRVTRLPRTACVWLVVALTVAMGSLAIWLAGPAIVSQAVQLRDLFSPAVAKMLAEVDAAPLLPYASELLARTGQLLNNVTALAASVLIVAFVAIAGALEPQLYRRGLLSLIPPAYRRRADEVVTRTISTLQLWLFARVLSMFATGALVWIALRILNVPLAGALSVLAAGLAFVPNIGAFLAAVPAVVLAFAQSPRLALFTAGAYVLVHVTDDFLVAPVLERRIVRLPPILTLAAQIALGLAAGALGVMLAAPIVAASLVLVAVLWIEPMEERKLS